MIEKLRFPARLTLAGAALASLLACSSKRPQAEPPAPEGTARGFRVAAEQRSRLAVTEVHEAEFHKTVEATGTVAFNQNASTQVIAPISGPVARILAPLGMRVAPGEPLAEVASPDFASSVAAYRKSVAGAANLRRIADLDQKLFEAGGIPRRDLEQAQTDALAAESDRDAALAQLHALGLPDETIQGIREGKTPAAARPVIRAPIAGTVVERLITPGQLLQAGATPCFTIADLSTQWVMTSVFEKDLPGVAAGDPAEILAGEGTAIPGRVEYVGDLVNPDTRAIPVRVVAVNRGGALKKDAYVRVRIQSRAKSRGILIPSSAVLLDSENFPFVFLEGADGTFSRRKITLGVRDGSNDEVTQGLASGDRVVTEGGLFIQFAESE